MSRPKNFPGVGKLTKKLLMAVPEGVYIVVESPERNLLYAAHAVKKQFCKVQWEEIRAMGVNGRTCWVYRRMPREYEAHELQKLLEGYVRGE